MRHQRNRYQLSRTASHRKALLMNLSKEVIEHERIETTEAKAKAVKPELEKLIHACQARRSSRPSPGAVRARPGQVRRVQAVRGGCSPLRASATAGTPASSSSARVRSDSTEMVLLELV